MSTWTQVPTEPLFSALHSAVPCSGDIEEGSESQTNELLTALNLAQSPLRIQLKLARKYGTTVLLASLGSCRDTGMPSSRVDEMRKVHGDNNLYYPSAATVSYITLLYRAIYKWVSLYEIFRYDIIFIMITIFMHTSLSSS